MQPLSTKRNLSRLIPLGFSFAVFVLAQFSPVTNAGSDPHFSLIVSQSIVQNGTIKLDAYEATHPQLFENFFWQIGTLPNGHRYYNYPIGPSLFSLPFVWLANLLGLDMLIVKDNHLLQNLLSAALCGLIFLLTYQVCRSYLRAKASLIVSGVSVLGSSLISTLATALWNMDYSVLFVLLSLLLITRYDSGRSKTLNAYALGLLLFLGYLCRPSTAIFILVVFVYLLIIDRSILVKTAATAFVPFAAFMIFTRVEYGLWFPIYYSASFWFNTTDIWKPLAGVLFSPSRGLFIFSPFLLIVVIGGIWQIGRLRRKSLFWLCALWITLQITSVSTTRQWWGGYSYGPRLLTDTLPAFIVITAIAWSSAIPFIGAPARKVLAGGYLALGLLAVLINSVQGIFNIKSALWNAFPSVDKFPEYVFDWKYPQFLITADSFHSRRLEHYQRQLDLGTFSLDEYQFGDRLKLSKDKETAIFIGWWRDSDWTEIQNAAILFVPGDTTTERQYALEITAASYGVQNVTVSLNGTEIGELVFPGQESTFRLEFPGSLLKLNSRNQIELSLPDASRPSLEDLRELGPRYAPHRLGLNGAKLTIQPTQ